MSESLKQLRSLSDDDIIRLHDGAAGSTIVGISHYLQELARRDQDRATQVMIKYTKQMRDFTIVVMLLTMVNVVIVLYSILQ